VVSVVRPWTSVRGRGVSELDVVDDVIDGKQDLAASVRTAQRHAPVGIVAVTTQRSPFFTQVLPVVTRRLF